MTNSITFKSFIESQPDWEGKYSVYQRDHKTFKRIVCVWEENADQRHEYHATINTRTGDMYLDCRRRKILAKHFALSFGRPLHTIVKTLWHLTVVGPLSVEIYRTAKGRQTKTDLAKNTLKSLADIIRTPVYGTAMTIMHIAGFILGCVAPNTLYDTRNIVGKLERKLLRADNIYEGEDFWWLSPCFSPIKNILPLNKSMEFIDDEEIIKDRLGVYAQRRVIERRTTINLFNGMRFQPNNVPYISSAKRN